VATVVTVVVVQDGLLSRAESVGFLVALALFIIWMVRLSRSQVTPFEAEEFREEIESRLLRPRLGPVGTAAAATAVGIGLLVVGGKLLVDGAVHLAEMAGMTPRVIGLTIVAVGTSAPEIATSIIAAVRKHTDVAVGNLIGSNMMNTLGILGATGAVAGVPVGPELAGPDMLWMLGATILILPMMWIGMRVSRRDGVLLLAVYAAYLWSVVG
jgi:cation:H+ antiporter